MVRPAALPPVAGPPAPTDLFDQRADFDVDLEEMTASGSMYVAGIESIRAYFGEADPKQPECIKVKGGPGMVGMSVTYGPGTLLRLAIRRRDLYILGFRGADDWLELREQGENHQILDSTLLNLRANYGSLFRHSTKPSVGHHLFRKCVTYLSGVPTAKINDEKTISAIADHILLLTISLAESARFNSVSNFIQQTIEGGADSQKQISEWVTVLVKNWALLSKAVRKYKGHDGKERVKERFEVMKKLKNGWELGTTEDVNDIREAVGMLAIEG